MKLASSFEVGDRVEKRKYGIRGVILGINSYNNILIQWDHIAEPLLHTQDFVTLCEPTTNLNIEDWL